MHPRHKYSIYSGSTTRPESSIRSTFPHPVNEPSGSSDSSPPDESRETSIHYLHRYAAERVGGRYPKLGLFSDDRDSWLEVVVPPLPTSGASSVRPFPGKSRPTNKKGLHVDPMPHIHDAEETLHLVSGLSLSDGKKGSPTDGKLPSRGDEPLDIEPSDSETSSSSEEDEYTPTPSTSTRSSNIKTRHMVHDKTSTNSDRSSPLDNSNTTAMRRSPSPSLSPASTRNCKRQKIEEPSPPSMSDCSFDSKDDNCKEIRNDPRTGKQYYVLRDSRGKHNYQCLTCPHIRTPNLGDIKRHFQSLRHQEHSFRCVPDCGKAYTREDALRRHIKTSHGGDKQKVVMIEAEKRAVRMEPRAQAGR